MKYVTKTILKRSLQWTDLDPLFKEYLRVKQAVSRQRRPRTIARSFATEIKFSAAADPAG